MSGSGMNSESRNKKQNRAQKQMEKQNREQKQKWGTIKAITSSWSQQESWRRVNKARHNNGTIEKDANNVNGIESIVKAVNTNAKKTMLMMMMMMMMIMMMLMILQMKPNSNFPMLWIGKNV